MIANVIIHLMNELPVVVDLEELPGGGDRSVRCTNVRTVDGKRPQFVHDRNGIFIFPMSMIRLIEAPPSDIGANGEAASESTAAQPHSRRAHTPGPADAAALVPVDEPPFEDPPLSFDEEPDEDLLARIRSV